jgi:hypothetical protein
MTSIPSSGLNRRRGEGSLPDDRIDSRPIILQAEIGMAGGMLSAIAGNLAPDPNMVEGGLDRPLDRTGQFRNRDLEKICLRIPGGKSVHASFYRKAAGISPARCGDVEAASPHRERLMAGPPLRSHST